MRILITNDDGINAPGLKTLHAIATDLAGADGEVFPVPEGLTEGKAGEDFALAIDREEYGVRVVMGPIHIGVPKAHRDAAGLFERIGKRERRAQGRAPGPCRGDGPTGSQEDRA